MGRPRSRPSGGLKINDNLTQQNGDYTNSLLQENPDLTMEIEEIAPDHLCPMWAVHSLCFIAGAIGVGFGMLPFFTSGILDAWTRYVLLPIAALALLAISYGVFRRWKRYSAIFASRAYQRLRTEFDRYKGMNFDESVKRVRADPEVEIVFRDRCLLANPRTWNRRQRVVAVKKGDFLISIIEHNFSIGALSYAWIRSNAEPGERGNSE